MKYNKIVFDARPFSYQLEFTSRITLVRGDSATGKTFLYQLLNDEDNHITLKKELVM